MTTDQTVTEQRAVGYKYAAEAGYWPVRGVLRHRVPGMQAPPGCVEAWVPPRGAASPTCTLGRGRAGRQLAGGWGAGVNATSAAGVLPPAVCPHIFTDAGWRLFPDDRCTKTRRSLADLVIRYVRTI